MEEAMQTRAQPTNRWCTECGEEVRLMPALFGTVPAAEHCQCTRTMTDAGDVEMHRIKAWRKL